MLALGSGSQNIFQAAFWARGDSPQKTPLYREAKETGSGVHLFPMSPSRACEIRRRTRADWDAEVHRHLSHVPAPFLTVDAVVKKHFRAKSHCSTQ